METYKLTKDCLRSMMLGAEVLNPNVQVLTCRKVETTCNDGKDRFRLMLSDGINKFFLVIFVTAKNDPMCAGDATIPLNSIVKLKKYVARQLDNNEQSVTHILLVLDLEIVIDGSIVGGIIGSPVLLTGETLRTLNNASTSNNSNISMNANTNNSNTNNSNILNNANTNNSNTENNSNNTSKNANTNNSNTENNSNITNNNASTSINFNISYNANTAYTARISTNNSFVRASVIFKPIYQNRNWFNTSRMTDLEISLIRRGGLTDPISSLRPFHFDWIIKARVSHKSNVRYWSNSNGKGMLFSMDLVDESGEIRCVAFRRQVEQFYDLIQVDKLYYITRTIITRANKQYNSLRNDYEMIMDFKTEIKLVPDAEATSIPEIKYSFTKIDQIANIEAGKLLDVIGVCKQAGDLVAFQSRSGQNFTKRVVLLVDQTDTVVTLTLWYNNAEKFNHTDNPVVVVKGVQVVDFGGGKNLSLLHGSQFRVNPNIKECHDLRKWYDNGGKSHDFKNISGFGNFELPWRQFKEVEDLILGHSENGDYYQVIGTILLINSENILYKACTAMNCNKKVVDYDNGTYRCEKCGKASPYFKYRLLAYMNVADCTGGQWVNMFNDDVEKVLGMTAAEVGKKCEEDSSELWNICQKALFKPFVMKCRTKTVTYNGETRVNTVVVHVEPIVYQKYNEHLITSIDSLLQK